MSGAFQMPKGVRANALARRRLLWDAAHVPGAAYAMRTACKEDIVFYVNAFCWTFDPRRERSVVPFVTYPFQDEAMLEIVGAIRDGRDVALKKSRDMGASWLVLAVLEWFWHFWEMKSFLIVSRNEDYVDAPGDSKSLFWKFDFLHEHQPGWLLPRRMTRTSMHLDNGDTGSIIDGESTTGDVARGDRRTAIMMDEFAAFETGAGYNALKATQSATDCRIFNSTPKGSANAFYDVVHKTTARIVEMHWSRHPIKARGLYRGVRNEKGRMELRLLSAWKGVVEVREKGSRTVRKVAFPEDYPFILDGKLRSPWYDRECARAVSPQEIAQELDIDFAGSDYQFFDPAAVQAYRERWSREPDAVGEFAVDAESCRVMRFERGEKGHWRFFEPLGRDDRFSDERRFVLGCDVSAGTGASNSTIAAYDAKTREKAAEYANPHVMPDDFGRLVVAAARFFNNALVVPDRSGPTGETMVRRMLASGYSYIYMRRNERKLGAPVTNEPGVFLNPAMRTTVLYQYRDAVGNASIINRSDVAMAETLKFICKMDGSIEHVAAANANDPAGARANHGDLVIADALANLGLSDASMREEAREAEPPHDSVAWRMREAERAKRLEESELGEEWEP